MWLQINTLILSKVNIFPVHVNAVKIKCKVGIGASAGSHDANTKLHSEDCVDGIKQCMKSGVKVSSKFTFTC